MNIPLEIQNRNVLIVGAGGGFDVLCGVPLGLQLMSMGNNVFYANYSFTELLKVEPQHWIYPSTLYVTHESRLSEGDYFPEKHLSEWLHIEGINNSQVYCFPFLGVKNLREQYAQIIRANNIEVIFIVDGGCDGIFRGDEYELGTPSMDSISIIAGSLQDIKEKYYVLTAFGTEGANHEVSHAEALERTSDLIKIKKFIGVTAMVPQDPVIQKYDSCISYIYKHLPLERHSNIVSSIRASYKGLFGDLAVTVKAEISPIWISPLTSLVWIYDLEAVAKMKLFYKDVLDSVDVASVSGEIKKHRPSETVTRKQIPI